MTITTPGEGSGRPSATTAGSGRPASDAPVGDRTRHLVTITAAPGWGKSTVAAGLTEGRRHGWLSLRDRHRDPAVLVGELTALGVPGGHPDGAHPDVTDPDAASRTIARHWAGSDLEVVVLDDAHVLAGSAAIPVLQALSTPDAATSQLVVVSRTALGLVDARRRAAGDVLELDAQRLALDLDTVAALVEHELTADRALAARLLDASGGWPVLIRLLIEAIRPLPATARSAAVDGACAPHGPVGEYLDTVVLAEERDACRELLARIALLGSACPTVLRTVTPHAELLDDVVTRGLARPDPVASDHLSLPPAVQRVVEERVLPVVDPDRSLVDGLADALLAQPAVGPALALLARQGRAPAVAELLEEHGASLLRAGELTVIDQAARALDAEHHIPRLQRLHAQALAVLGDWVGAMAVLEASGLPTDGPLPTDLALQAGLIHHLRGDLEAALATYARADDPESPGSAALHAWAATAHWLRGDLDAARPAAEMAMRTASRDRDDSALALAHTALALLAASDGDRHANEAHYRQALHAAQRAGDLLQEARIRTNWGSHHLEEGDYLDAREQTEIAIDLAERTGFAMIAGIAHCNRADILLRTGEIDQAIADAQRGREILAAIGARTEAYAHHLLGDARTERGELALAEQAFERALRLAEPAGDRQALVPAYLGLAAVRASSDLDAAADAAATALELDDGMLRAEASLASAWVAAARGDADACREHAVRAREEASARDNAAVVAEASTCLALLEEDPVPALEETRLLWEQLDAPLWTTRIDLAIARRSSEPQAASRIAWLERRLAGWGCPPDRGSIAHRLLLTVERVPRVVIRALGGFVVEREGRPLTSTEWGSRKAQDLVKILVVRSGRSTSREELAHLLWPDQPYEDVSNRLSVALSLARSALTGEGAVVPIVTQGATVRLDTDTVDLDVETFGRLAEDGLRAARRDGPDAALPVLTRAEELYGGDLLEDDLDTPWLTDRRLALRSAYLEVARTIARLTVEDDPDLAIRMLLRILDRDSYDEPAHLNLCLALLRSGRHGEARRRFRVYEGRMHELELPVVPFHELTREVDDAARAAS